MQKAATIAQFLTLELALLNIKIPKETNVN